MPSTFYIVYDLETHARLSLFFSKCNIAGNLMSRLKFCVQTSWCVSLFVQYSLSRKFCLVHKKVVLNLSPAHVEIHYSFANAFDAY